MKRYCFEDFPLERDNNTYIQDGIYGYKVEISLFNPLVPEIFREMALDVLNRYMNTSSNKMTVNDIELITGSVEAYLQRDVWLDKKYTINLFIWTKMENPIHDYVWKCQMMPNDSNFHYFRECVMAELKDMIFGKF